VSRAHLYAAPKDCLHVLERGLLGLRAGGRDRGDESGFPGALDAIEAYEEGFCGVEVGGEAREDEGDTMGGFVVYDFGFKGCGGERSIGGGYRSHFERIIRPLR
jgi:hypothetical protein